MFFVGDKVDAPPYQKGRLPINVSDTQRSVATTGPHKEAGKFLAYYPLELDANDAVPSMYRTMSAGEKDSRLTLGGPLSVALHSILAGHSEYLGCASHVMSIDKYSDKNTVSLRINQS